MKAAHLLDSRFAWLAKRRQFERYGRLAIGQLVRWERSVAAPTNNRTKFYEDNEVEIHTEHTIHDMRETESDVPVIPLHLGDATHVIAQSRMRRVDGTRLRKGMTGWRPEVSKAEREHTPPALAAWLVELARRTRVDARAAA
jgi:hypothetical protein